MDLMKCAWWQFAEVKSFSNRLQNAYVVEGILCWEIDGREEWLLFSDGQGLFEVATRGALTFHDNTSPIFLEMVNYIHREDWVDWVLDEMESRLDDFIDTEGIEEPNYREVCDAAYEWLPYVLPKTYGKVFPSSELLDTLMRGFFIEEADPQITNYEQ